MQCQPLAAGCTAASHMGGAGKCASGALRWRLVARARCTAGRGGVRPRGRCGACIALTGPAARAGAIWGRSRTAAPWQPGRWRPQHLPPPPQPGATPSGAPPPTGACGVGGSAWAAAGAAGTFWAAAGAAGTFWAAAGAAGTFWAAAGAAGTFWAAEAVMVRCAVSRARPALGMRRAGAQGSRRRRVPARFQSRSRHPSPRCRRPWQSSAGGVRAGVGALSAGAAVRRAGPWPPALGGRSNQTAAPARRRMPQEEAAATCPPPLAPPP
jgi:hypothetical protein